MRWGLQCHLSVLYPTSTAGQTYFRYLFSEPCRTNYKEYNMGTDLGKQGARVKHTISIVQSTPT